MLKQLLKAGPIISRCLRNELGSLTVLSYHRVVTDPLSEAVNWPTPLQFRQQMQWLKKFGRICDLADGIDLICRKQTSERLCAITFDDGYADNFEFALPILLSESMTATFFIATSYLDGKSMFNDIVRHAILKTEKRSYRNLTLPLIQFALSSRADRVTTANRSIEALKYLTPDERDSTALEIARELEVQPPKNLMMRPEHVLKLHRSGMGIGSHTHRHIVANTVDKQEFVDDVSRSTEILKNITGQTPAGFAFPNGRSEIDQTPIHTNLVKQLGFSYSLTTDLGSISQQSDPYALPRFTPWASNSLGFKLQLNFSRLGLYAPNTERIVQI